MQILDGGEGEGEDRIDMAAEEAAAQQYVETIPTQPKKFDRKKSIKTSFNHVYVQQQPPSLTLHNSFHSFCP